jgi:hypothetical protein
MTKQQLLDDYASKKLTHFRQYDVVLLDRRVVANELDDTIISGPIDTCELMDDNMHVRVLVHPEVDLRHTAHGLRSLACYIEKSCRDAEAKAKRYKCEVASPEDDFPH